MESAVTERKLGATVGPGVGVGVASGVPEPGVGVGVTWSSVPVPGVGVGVGVPWSSVGLDGVGVGVGASGVGEASWMVTMPSLAVKPPDGRSATV